jgi:hypothetical protein
MNIIKKSEGINFQELYERLQDGDVGLMSDKELELLYDHVKTTGLMLHKLGPLFRISAYELLHRADQMEGYISARQQRRAENN